MTTFLGMRESERTALFIDGQNLFEGARRLGFEIDLKYMLAQSRAACRLVRAYYYMTILEGTERDASSLRPLADWLDYNGYHVVARSLPETPDAPAQRRRHGAIDIDLAVDMMGLAPRLDHVIVFSGNGYLKRAVAAIQAMGVRVSVISTEESDPPMASNELRRQADRFFDLADIQEDIGREAKPED